MNTASLELCKELFELSGWKPQHTIEVDWAKNKETKHAIPAYDLGYLLRKTNIGVRPHDKGWKAFFYDETVIADTPENAACKLAIQLIKHLGFRILNPIGG